MSDSGVKAIMATRHLLLGLLILYNAGLTAGRVSVPSSVTAVVGYPASIPCDLTPPSPSDSPHLILWYKNIFGTPIYSLDMRNGAESASHWRDRTVLGDRVSFQVATSNTSRLTSRLVFNTTLPQDAGPYRCRVDFWKAATRNYKIYLQLIEEAQTVQIYDGKKTAVTGGVIVARINSTLVLTCQATGGRPLPTLSWQSSSPRVLQGNSSVSTASQVSSVLVISRLQPSDANTVISCIAINNQLEVPPSAAVRLDIVLAPVRVEMSRTVSSFLVGSSYNITCQVLGSHPPPHTTLWLAGQELEVVRRTESEDGKIFTTVASFSPQPGDDNKFLSCRAFNKYVPEETLEDQWKISVLHSPVTALSITTSSDPLAAVVREGDRLELNCSAEARPPPFNYHWRQEGESKVVPHSGLPSQLILASVTRDDAGNYTCLAENSHGLGQSNNVTITVLYIPTCRLDHDTILSIAVHESVDLECEVTARPENVTFSWEMELGEEEEEERVMVATSQFTQHSTRSVLTFTPRTPGDFGRVVCTGSNTVGAGKPCVFNIAKKVTLPGVHACSVTNKLSSISVSCQENTKARTSQFRAELVDLKLGLETSLMSSNPTFHFSSVRPGALFNLTIYRNVDVKTMEEKMLVFTQTVRTADTEARTLVEEDNTEEKALDRMVPLIIILSCLITVLVFVMIIVTLVKKSSEYGKNSGLQTHVAFNKNLDKDIEPDIVNHTKQSLHKVYSLDQLNQVSFEGFTSLNPNLIQGKYNTLPARQIAIIESVYSNQEQTPLIQTPKSILVKKVTFEKPASSASESEGSEGTLEGNTGTYLDTPAISSPLQLSYESFQKLS